MAFKNLAVSAAQLTTLEVVWVQTLAAATPTKGRIYVANGTAWTYLERSLTNDQVLMVDTTTATGVKWGANPAGVTNHALLSNLDYASAAHTGFEPTVTKGNLTESTSSVLTIGSGTGAVIGSGTTIQVKQASGAQSGYLSNGDWTTFSGKQNALSFGNLTELTSSVLTIGGGTGAVIGTGATITVTKATALADGYLAAADFSIFTGKQDALSFPLVANLGGTGIANNAASTITISGSYALTLTLSNTTALNLPTSGTVTALGNSTTGSGAIVLASSPVLTTPTIDFAVMTQGTTPGNPASGYDKLYFKSDNKLYRLTSGGAEAEVGGTGGGGSPAYAWFIS